MKKTFYIVFFLIGNLIFSQTTDRFTLKNVKINTNYNEFGTVIPKDGSIYYSKSVFKNNQDLNELSANLFKGELASGGEISKDLKFPTDAVHAVFSNDGKTVYYSKKDGKKFQLFQAIVDNIGRWKNEIKLPFNEPKYTFKHPTLNKDNTKLYFVSDKSDTYGNTDIYYVNISNHGLDFSKPVHLNFYVNSPKEEIFPCVGEKDKLYFSSNGMGGIGRMDIFESFYNNGNYEKTANLGEPINSKSDDFAFSLISDNHRGFLSSNRAGGAGGVDIYYFEDKKSTLNKCSKSITGYVKNKETKKPIAEATIDIFDSKGNNENTLTDSQGSFTIDNVECETTYDIVSYKEGYNGFAEIHTSPLNSEIIYLYLNPEFPEGYKEEFDFSNEITVTESKSNKVINDKPKVENEKKIALQKQAIAEAKNRDIQSTVESEKITTTNPSKNQNTGSKVEENDYYLVKKGDGLYSIAKNNNLTVEELKSINSLKNNVITEGQKLIVKKSNNYNDIEKAKVNTKNSEVKESSDLELIVNVNKEKVKKDKFSGIEKIQTNVSNTETENLRLTRIAKAKATLEKLKKDNEQYKIAYVDHSNTNNVRQEVTENFNKNNQTNNCNRNINGYIKNSITKKIIANAKIELFFEDQNLETASTNANGEFFFNNVACDTKYTIICFKEGFDNIAKAVIDTKTATKDITILIQPNDDNAIASNNKVIDAKKTYEVVKKIAQNKVKKEEDKMTYYVESEEIVVPKIAEGKVILNPIYFDLDEWYLTAPARRELNKIILLMKLNPTLIIESGSHTDTQGSFDYNLNLSEKRSQKTVGYLIANGADPDRISGNGYGETMPTNHCLDGVKCSQKEHFENRRTEFVILKQ